MVGSSLGAQLGKALFVGIFLVALTACGGGGSTGTDSASAPASTSSSGSTNPPPPTTPPPPTATATYTLSWNAVNDPNVTGYRVYYGTSPLSSGGSASHIDVSISNTAVDFTPGNYGIPSGASLYAAVSSTGSGGFESPISTVVSVVVQ